MCPSLCPPRRKRAGQGDWEEFAQRLFALTLRLPREASLETLSVRRDGLSRLQAEVEKAWLDSLLGTRIERQ